MLRNGGMGEGRLPDRGAGSSPVCSGCLPSWGLLIAPDPPPPPHYRPLLAGRPGAGTALLQPPATQLMQAGPRRGARVLARRVTLLALRAARLGRRPRPGPVPVSRGVAGRDQPLPGACGGLLGPGSPWHHCTGSPCTWGEDGGQTPPRSVCPNPRPGGRPPPLEVDRGASGCSPVNWGLWCQMPIAEAFQHRDGAEAPGSEGCPG